MSDHTQFYVDLFTKLHKMNRQYGLIDEANIIHGEEWDTVEMQESIVIPCEDPILHIEGNPFCWDAECPCREDTDNVNMLNDMIELGLITEDEVALIMRGATI